MSYSGLQPGTPVATTLLQGNVALSYTTNLTTVDHFKFDVVTDSLNAGGIITLDTATAYTSIINVASLGRITLAGGKKYKLWGTNNNSSPGTGGHGAYKWLNADTGASIGLVTGSAQTNSTVDRSPGYGALAIFSPGADTRVELRITFSNWSSIRGVNDAIGPAQFLIEVIG